MKRSMLSRLWLFAALPLLLFACAPEEGGGDSPIVGTWQFVLEEGHEIINGKLEPWTETFDYERTYTFDANGRFSLYDAKDKDTDVGEYKYKNSKLTLIFDYDEDNPETYLVKKLNYHDLEFEFTEADGSFYIKNTLRRIK